MRPSRQSVVKPVYNFRNYLALILVGLFGVSGMLLGGWGSQTAEAAAGINKQLNFQGRLLNSSGAVVADGNYNLRFKVYQDGSGCVTSGTPPCSGTLMWTELWQNSVATGSSSGVTVRNGYFSVALGTFCAFSGGSCQGNSNTGVAWNQDTLWVSVDVGGTAVSNTPTYDGEMTPFRRLASSVYSLQAENANTLGGLSASQFIQTVPAVGVNVIAPTAASSVALTVKASTAGGTNSLEVFDSSNTRQAFFDASGNLNVARTIQPTTTNAVDVGLSGTQFRTGYFGTSVITPTIDTASAVTFNIGAAGSPTTSQIALNQDTQVAAGKNFSLASGTGTLSQTYTGTTGNALSVTANSLTSGRAVSITSSNNTAANTNWSGSVFGATNAQGTTAVTGLISGFDIQFTQGTSVAGNNETALNVAIAQNNSSSTDATVNSIINVANNDTATGNQITASRGISITGTNVTDGLYLNGTFGTNLINTSSGNFVVTQGGAGTFASTVQGTTLNGTTGINTGATGGTQRIDASGNLVNIGNITGTGAVTIASGGAGALTLNSASNVLVLDATDTTLQRTAAGTYTINLVDGANTTLAVTNSGAGVANMTVDGGITATAAVQGATATFTGSSALTLGTSSTNTGAVIFRGSGGAGTLTLQGPTTPNGGNFTLTIPAITGNANVCTDNAICSGYAASSGSGNYIQNQIAAQQSSSNFWISGTGRADTSILTPTLDTPSGTTTLAIGTTNATTGINLNQDVVVAANKNLTLTSGTGRIIQTFTGTTTDATSVTANSLTTGTGLRVTTSNNTAANTNWSGTVFNPTNAQGTTAVTGLISGLDVQFTQAATVAGNTETVANFAITANASSVTDNTVNSIVRIQNNDTATGNQITATSGIQVDGANTTNGITFSGTFGNNLINTSTSNFTVAQSGALTSASTIQGTSVNGTTGINTGSTGGTQRIDASGNLVNIGNITGTGAVSLTSGGAGALTLDSASNILVIAANDTTLQRTAAGTYTVNLVDGANTTLAVTNSGAGTASITADGDITASGNIQGVNVNGTTGVNTGAAGGTQRIDASGNIVNIGNITGTGAVTLSSGGAGALTLDSASNVLVFAATDATLQRTASGTTTLNLVDGANTTLAVTNSGAGNANITADGNITANGNVQGATGAFTGAGGITLGVTGSTSGRIDFDGSTGASGTITLQAPANPATYSLTLPSSAPGTSQCLQTDSGNSALLVFGSCGSGGTFLAKNAADTSSAAITASNFLYSFTNSSSAVASGVLRVDNGTNTNSAVSVTAAGNPGAGQALIFASNTNASPTGNLIDLQAGSSPTTRFSVTAGGVASATTSVLAPLFDTPSGTTTLNIGTTNATVGINLNQDVVVATNKNLTLTSGTGRFIQTFTGTTTDAHSVTANSLTTGTGLKVTTSNNTAANTNWSGTVFNATNAQGTTAVTGLISGFDVQFTQGTAIAGNNETVANFAIAANNSASTDSAVNSIINVANNDTATGNQITASRGISITGTNVTDGLYLNGTFGTNLINTSTGNLVITQAGAITAASTIQGTSVNGTTGINTGAAGGTQRIDASGNLVNIGNITGTGAVSLTSGGAGALTLDSASAVLVIAANDTTLQRTAAGTYTVNLVDGANTTLAVTNSGAGNANITADGNITATGSVGGATASFTGANALNLGTSSTNTGAIVFRGSGGAGTLTLQGPTTPNASNFTLTIPAITGNANVCTDNSICTGYAASSGSGNYIQNQIAAQQSSSNFWISAIGRADTSFLTPLLDTPSGTTTLNVGTTNATAGISLNQNVIVAANRNLTLNSGTGRIVQTYTGTTTDAASITANSLTSGAGLRVTTSNNTAANTNWSGTVLAATNAQGTTAVTGLISGFDLQFTQGTAVAGNTETVANFAVAQNNSASTDATVNSIINVANNDTATGNQITVSRGLSITGSNITDGIYLNGTFGTNLINTSTSNFIVTQGGALTSASTIQGTSVNGTTGINTGAAGGTQRIDASGNLVNIGNITGTGAVTLASGGAGALTFNSASNTIVVDATDTLLQRTASGTFTFDLVDAANTTLAITNSNGTGVANVTVDGQMGAATGRIQPASDTNAFQVYKSGGAQLFAVDTQFNLIQLGSASTNATLRFANVASGGNTVSLTLGTVGAGNGYTLTLPITPPATSQCLLTNSLVATQLEFGSCSGSGSDIQAAYSASPASQSEIILDNTRGALDLQDRSTNNGGSIAANLFNVRATAANDTTVGSLLFGIGNTGLITQTPSANLTNGQIGLQQTLTMANATASGTVKGIQQNITVSNTTAGTATGLEVLLADNSTALSQSSKGITVVMSGTNTSARSTGVSSTVSNGFGSTFSSSEGTSIFGTNTSTGSGSAFYGGVLGTAVQTATSGTTSLGVQGGASSGAGSTVYGGYFSVLSGNTATAGAALYATTANGVAGAGANGGNAVNVLQVQGGAGGNSSTGSGFTAGVGAPISLVAGAGGNVSLGTGLFAGTGGGVTITSGAGGAVSSGTGTGGSGGNVTISGGAGTNGTIAGGNGGNVVLQGGTLGTGTTNGTAGIVVVKSGSNNTSALQVQTSTSTAVFDVATDGGADATAGTVLIDTANTFGGGAVAAFNGGGWTTTNWSTTATTATHLTTGGNTSSLQFNTSLTIGTTYEATYTYSGCSVTDGLQISGGGITIDQDSNCIGNGSYTNSKVFTATATTTFRFTPTSTYTGTVSAVTLRVINKNNEVLTVRNSTGVASLEVRTGGSVTNSFVGLSSGAANISSAGINNTAFGYLTLQSNTTGFGNTAFGTEALGQSAQGAQNTAIGFQALRLSSGIAGTSGQRNVAVGYSALSKATTASNNVAIGYQAGQNILTGDGNVFIGLQTGLNDPDGFTTQATVADAVAIGPRAQVHQDDSIILGATGTNQVRVGIGTTAPTNTFSVSPLQYSTGTAGTSGATTTTLTGSGTTWTRAMIGGEIIFFDGTKRTVTGWTSATSITLSASVTYAGTANAYRIHYYGFGVATDGTVLMQQTVAHAVNETTSNATITVFDNTNAGGSVTSTTNGLNVATTLNVITGTGGTKTVNAIEVGAPTLTACTGGSTCVWNGARINTQATGAAAAITQNGLNITAAGVGAGALNGINISGITGGAGTETAITIGSGWDTGINVGSGLIVTSNLGVEFTESDTNPACAAGNYNIYADTSEAKLKKCTNGTVTDLDTGGGGSGYATIQDEASNLTQRATVNFTGGAVSCADNAGSTRTDCTIGFTSTDGTGATSSASGMETGTNGFGLLQGCADNEVLKWNESSSIWECGSDRATVAIRKATGETVTNSTTLQDDNELIFSAGTNQTWIVETNYTYTTNSNATPDIRVGLNGPTGSTCVYGYLDISHAGNFAAGATTCNTAIVTATTATGTKTGRLAGTVTTSSTAGNIAFRFAQGSTDATNGTTVVAGSSLLAYRVDGADLAETYYTEDSGVVPGTLVSLDPEFEAGVKKSGEPYDSRLLGIISTRPGLAIGAAQPDMRGLPTMVALAGRVPVRVSTENGEIKAGDYLTSSSTPGVAMKATEPGYAIAQALTGFSGEGEGVVAGFIKPGWYQPPRASVRDLQNGSLSSNTVMGLKIDGALVVTGDAVFAGRVSARDIAVSGHITVGRDVAGSVNIRAGERRAAVTFERAYETAPVVTLGASEFVLTKVTEKTTRGFVIELAVPFDKDVKIDWTALEVKRDP